MKIVFVFYQKVAQHGPQHHIDELKGVLLVILEADVLLAPSSS